MVELALSTFVMKNSLNTADQMAEMVDVVEM
jgi:hypothetical protein